MSQRWLKPCVAYTKPGVDLHASQMKLRQTFHEEEEFSEEEEVLV